MPKMKSRKNTGKYLKYRNGPGKDRPQRTGVNKKSGPDTGSAVPRSRFRSMKIRKYADMCMRHKNPKWCIQNNVPAHLVGDVAQLIASEGVRLEGTK